MRCGEIAHLRAHEVTHGERHRMQLVEDVLPPEDLIGAVRALVHEKDVEVLEPRVAGLGRGGDKVDRAVLDERMRRREKVREGRR